MNKNLKAWAAATMLPGGQPKRARKPDLPAADPPTVAPGAGIIEVRVRKASCRSGCWRWSVLVDGQVWESGDKAKTEAEAYEQANAEADEIRSNQLGA